jgi:hypothetical protein
MGEKRNAYRVLVRTLERDTTVKTQVDGKTNLFTH